MSTQFDHRYESKFPVAVVYAALVDRGFLQARLAELGGPAPSIVEYRADASGAAYRLRHTLDSSGMPPAVRSLLAGNLVVERSEAWTPQADGNYRGTIAVGVTGSPVPASASGDQALIETPAGGCEHTVRAAVTVSVPFFGARIEEYVAEQVRALLDMEATFAARWLEQHAT